MVRLFDFSKAGQDTEARIEKGILPGALLSVSIEGEQVYNFSAGFCDVEAKKPLSSNNLFRLASMTKPITVSAVLIQQDRGLLNVHDPVSKYIPAFKEMDIGRLENGKPFKVGKAEREMTIEDILTHSSGIGSGALGDFQYQTFGHAGKHSLEEIVDGYAGMLLDFSPGTSQMYSPTCALDIAARIVEITAKMPYEDFLKQNLFEPLDMKDTGYTLTSKQWDRVVPMYRLSDDVTHMDRTNMTRVGFSGYPMGFPGGAAGLVSSLNDYTNFANMLCQKGVFQNKRVLSETAIEKMRTPHFEIGFAGINEYFNWGYGVRIVMKAEDGVQMLSPSSFGWSGAYNTHFWVDPVQKLTGVYMCNLDNAGGAGAITAFEFECNVMRALQK